MHDRSLAQPMIRLSVLAALAMLSLAGGCETEQRTRSTFDGYGEYQVYTRGGQARAQGGQASTIVVDRFQGPDHQTIAQQRSSSLAMASRLDQWWVMGDERESYVAYGRYGGQSDPRLLADQQRLTLLARNGTIRLSMLQVKPVVHASASSAAGPGGANVEAAGPTGATGPAPDLATVSPNQAEYTLQIGYFEDPNKRDLARKAAVTWANELREEGFDAYYFHGPNRSMVTVGLFGNGAAIYDAAGVVRYSTAVRQLQKRFPYNLYNGRTTRLRRNDGSSFDQPSFLVRIPRR